MAGFTGRSRLGYCILGPFLKTCRVVQFVCLVATISIASRLILEIQGNVYVPPAPLIAMLCMVGAYHPILTHRIITS